MSHWELRQVPFNFSLSDLTLGSVAVALQVRPEKLGAPVRQPQALQAPVQELLPGSQGFVERGVPLEEQAPVFRASGDYLCYVPQHYRHCFIDLGMGFEAYQAKFSSKTRATITRKVRKFAEQTGGTLRWQAYRTPAEIETFLQLALPLSRRTYQDRLLDAGLPTTESFRAQAQAWAAADAARAYLLFDGERAVSYLFCPASEGVLSYSYQGYDPEYMKLSVGTVLQWLALEDLFKEGKFRFFDFTEGESDHKRLFATEQRLCANIFLVRRSVANSLLLRAHYAMNLLSGWLGRVVERLGLKARLKRMLRFGRSAAA
ncbi:GNAT family N-acetyltransferase [Pseudoduganella violaceinigra]|uniref:GNAT family N-acetyltransferase n=1 Tax=Pseudoduganella violaceinigra TaxID=246602 RepID=UPI00041B7811|nr:GNAT family N-acetyltransferase [Pseudoduganella violaceinigra]